MQKLHIWPSLDRFPASLESEAGERTLSKVGIQVQWPILKKIPIAADKMGTELEPAVHKFSENGCEKRFLFTTFVTIITWLSSPHLITAQLAWYITRISHFPRFCISPKHYFAFVWPWDRLHTIFTVYFSLFTACISTHDLFHWNGAILTHSGQFSS